jgi:hypothetical protein
MTKFGSFLIKLKVQSKERNFLSNALLATMNMPYLLVLISSHKHPLLGNARNMQESNGSLNNGRS